MKTLFFVAKIEAKRNNRMCNFFNETTIFSEILEIFPSVHTFRAIPHSKGADR